MRVPSPKTAHIEGMDARMIPLFPELRPYLMEVFDEAKPRTEHVITRYRQRNVNLRTQLHRIIRKAGLDPWQKLFQNLRSTRETELVETYPLHVVCKWIGNSQPVATQHYLQLTDEHFARAVRGEHCPGDMEAAQNAAQQPAKMIKTDSKRRARKNSHPAEASEDDAMVPVGAGPCENAQVPPRGVEPLFSD